MTLTEDEFLKQLDERMKAAYKDCMNEKTGFGTAALHFAVHSTLRQVRPLYLSTLTKK